MERICNRCKKTFPLTNEFWYPHPTGQDGFLHRCKFCLQEKARQNHYTKAYNLTEWEIDQMREKQQWACAICKEVVDNLVVDHDHTTNAVRALLCTWCNSMLGYAKDRIPVLQGGIEYLQSFQHNLELRT